MLAPTPTIEHSSSTSLKIQPISEISFASDRVSTMEEALWKRIEPILDQILDLDPVERDRYLDQACQDPDLRVEIERFLDECLVVDGFLDEDTLDLAKEHALDHSLQEHLVDRRFGAYRTVKVLGKGGMGTVLLAERADGHFEQEVAIKVVNPRRLGDQHLERFRFERQILASLEHPFIAKLLDGGISDNGMPFLVMDHVQGLPLDQHVERTKPQISDRLRLVIDICSAIDHAHRRRVVHLDLKPSNILITPEGRPKVLDFGIAQMLDHQSADSYSSSSGRMTPHYAAPEQLRGESVTSSCDVYSLGVILFQLLTGQLPFERGKDGKESIDAFIERISEISAPRPSERENLAAADELDAIVAKSLHKNPLERYVSAADLADDLERLLDDRPVRALPPSRFYEWKKNIQRNRRLWLAGLAVSLFVAFLISAWWKDHRSAKERLKVAQEFAREAEGIESFLRYAYALPAHDVRREKALSLDRMADLQDQMRTLGSIAEGPGNLALGRALLMLHRPREARRHLQQAWDSGLESSELAFALGKAFSEIYRQEQTAALEIRDPEIRAVEIQRLGDAYRDPSLELLARVNEVSELTSPALVAAMVALLKEQPEEALKRADQATDEAPWLPDGLRLKGEAWLSIAQTHVAEGRWEDAVASSDKAIEALQQASLLAPSDTLIADILCDTYLTRTAPARLRRAPQDQTAGRAACRHASELDPSLHHSRLQLARLHVYSMQDPSLPLDDRLVKLEEGLSIASSALDSAPGDPDVLTLLGSAYLTRAVFLSRAKGEDPRQDLEAASSSLKQATTASPGLIVAHVNLGTAMAILAEERLARGEDPDPAFELAIQSFQQALDRSPNHSAILNNLGNLLYNRAKFQYQQGKDTSEGFLQALAICERILDLNPDFIQAYNLQGVSLESLARISVARRSNPRRSNPQSEAPLELLEKAHASLSKAHEINPSFPLPWINEGSLFLVRAAADLRLGIDPNPSINKAMAALESAKSLSTVHHETLTTNLAGGLLLSSRWRLAQGMTLELAKLDRIERLVNEGLDLAPRSPTLRLQGAQWALLKAQGVNGIDREAHLVEAERLLEALLSDRPSFAEAHLLAAELCLWRIAEGGPMIELATLAQHHLDTLDHSDGRYESDVKALRALLLSDSSSEVSAHAQDSIRASELERLAQRIKLRRARDAATPAP